MVMSSNSGTDSSAPRLQIFVHELGATGVARNAIAVANEAAASGYEVRLLTSCADGVLRNSVSPEVTIVALNDIRGLRASRRAELQRAFFAYRRHSRNWAPDIMMSAGNHGHLLSTLAWFGLPGAKLLRYSNDLAHGSTTPMTRIRRAGKFRLMAKLSDRIVYVSRAQGRHPLLARQLAAGKAVVIPNGVDLDFVRMAASQPCDHPWVREGSVPMVLAVGRHVKQKNFPALLTAFAKARAVRPMRLLFLGEGEGAAIERMKRLASELGVEEWVAFVAPVPNPFPYMAAARAFVLPSRWEGSANVLLEAMACGAPVIASRTAGDAEHVLAGGEYGLLFDPDDIDGLAAAIVRQTGPDPVAPGGRADCFSRKAAMRAYIDLFDELADRPARAAGPTTGLEALERASAGR